jgi:hypothetical protein
MIALVAMLAMTPVASAGGILRLPFGSGGSNNTRPSLGSRIFGPITHLGHGRSSGETAPAAAQVAGQAFATEEPPLAPALPAAPHVQR